VLVQHSDVDRRRVAARRRGRTPRHERSHDAILIVDAVSSLGIADLPMDAWGIDWSCRAHRRV